MVCFCFFFCHIFLKIVLWAECLYPFQSSYVEILAPSVMVRGGGPSGMIRYEGGARMNGLSALVRRRMRQMVMADETRGC